MAAVDPDADLDLASGGARVLPSRLTSPHVREGVQMALYVSVTMFGALALIDATSGSHDTPVGDTRAVATVWSTALGLTVAHWFAFSLAGRLVQPDAPRRQMLPELSAQLAGAVAVALFASVVIAIVPDENEVVAGELAVAVFIGLVVAIYARGYGANRLRTTVLAVGGALLGVLVAVIEHTIRH